MPIVDPCHTVTVLEVKLICFAFNTIELPAILNPRPKHQLNCDHIYLEDYGHTGWKLKSVIACSI